MEYFETVYENVELPLTYLNVSAAERKQRVEEMLSRMNMGHRAKQARQDTQSIHAFF